MGPLIGGRSFADMFGRVGAEFEAITRGMAAAVQRLGASPGLRTAADVAAGIVRPSGDVVACWMVDPAHRIPLRLAAEAMLRAFREDMRPGDAFVVNDPYEGGSSLCCLTLLVPVVVGEVLEMGVVVRARHADVGGAGPGGCYLQATQLFQEGHRVPPLRLAQRGRVMRDRWTALLKNTRLPGLYDADLAAILQAARWGAARTGGLVNSCGRDAAAEVAAGLLQRGEDDFRHLLASWPAGRDGETIRWTSGPADAAGVSLTVAAGVTVGDDGLDVDFAGSSGSVPAPFNSPLANTWASALAPLRSLLPPGVWDNDGFLRAVSIAADAGSMANASPPAPTGLCEFVPGMAIQTAVARALSRILEREVPEPRAWPWGVVGRWPAAAQGRETRTPLTGVPSRTFYDQGSWLRIPDWAEGRLSHEEVELQYPLRLLSNECIRDPDGGTFSAIRMAFETTDSETPMTIIIGGGGTIEVPGALSPRGGAVSMAMGPGARCVLTIDAGSGQDSETSGSALRGRPLAGGTT